jgi:hypothetical protein
MTHQKVKNGSIRCDNSSEPGLFLLSCWDEDSQTKMVLTVDQLALLKAGLDHLLRCSGIVPYGKPENSPGA